MRERWIGLLITALVLGCSAATEPSMDPSTVTETGYLTCEADAAVCGDAEAKCVDVAGKDHCVPIPIGCDQVTCDCLASVVCGDEACQDAVGGGLQCGEPATDPNEASGSDPATDPDPNTDPDPATDPDPSTDPGTDPNPDPSTDPEPDPDPDPSTDPDPGTDPNLETDTDADGSPDDVDCAPEDASVFPGAVEICNALDDDCDGMVDEGVCNDPSVGCAPDEVFLSPGCGEGDGVPFDAGCYATALLGCESDSDCPDDKGCLEIVFDPCGSSGCDACGQYDFLCLTSSDPSVPGTP